MGLADGDLYVSGSILSYQQMKRIYQNFRGASVPSNLQPGGLWSDSDNDKIYHRGASAVEEILQLTRSADASPQFATIRFMDSGADHYLDISCEEELTANKLLYIVVGDTNRVITLSGNTTLADWFDQAVKVASSPTHVKITLSDGQISFPSTAVPDADANTLDDYEEGTWTPGVTFGGAAVGVTYHGDNGGFYTKIGNVVTVTGYLSLTSKGTSVGDAYLTGLPFTVVNSPSGYAGAALRIAEVSFANQYQGYLNKNATVILLTETTEGGVETTLTNVDFADTSKIMINATYRVE